MEMSYVKSYSQNYSNSNKSNNSFNINRSKINSFAASPGKHDVYPTHIENKSMKGSFFSATSVTLSSSIRSESCSASHDSVRCNLSGSSSKGVMKKMMNKVSTHSPKPMMRKTRPAPAISGGATNGAPVQQKSKNDFHHPLLTQPITSKLNPKKNITSTATAKHRRHHSNSSLSSGRSAFIGAETHMPTHRRNLSNPSLSSNNSSGILGGSERPIRIHSNCSAGNVSNGSFVGIRRLVMRSGISHDSRIQERGKDNEDDHTNNLDEDGQSFEDTHRSITPEIKDLDKKHSAPSPLNTFRKRYNGLSKDINGGTKKNNINNNNNVFSDTNITCKKMPTHPSDRHSFDAAFNFPTDGKQRQQQSILRFGSFGHYQTRSKESLTTASSLIFGNKRKCKVQHPQQIEEEEASLATNLAVVSIQSMWRGYQAKQMYSGIIQLIIKIQTRWRIRLAKYSLHEKKLLRDYATDESPKMTVIFLATKIQAVVRGYLQRVEYEIEVLEKDYNRIVSTKEIELLDIENQKNNRKRLIYEEEEENLLLTKTIQKSQDITKSLEEARSDLIPQIESTKDSINEIKNVLAEEYNKLAAQQFICKYKTLEIRSTEDEHDRLLQFEKLYKENVMEVENELLIINYRIKKVHNEREILEKHTEEIVSFVHEQCNNSIDYTFDGTSFKRMETVGSST